MNHSFVENTACRVIAGGRLWGEAVGKVAAGQQCPALAILKEGQRFAKGVGFFWGQADRAGDNNRGEALFREGAGKVYQRHERTVVTGEIRRFAKGGGNSVPPQVHRQGIQFVDRRGQGAGHTGRAEGGHAAMQVRGSVHK